MQNKITKPEKTISPSNLPSIITAVVLIVGIGAVYGLIGYLFSGIKENITPVIQVSENRSDLDKSEKPVVFEEEGDISDWKVYRNEKYGYEIKYPEDWKNEGNTDDYFFQTFFESKNAEFLVRTNQLDSVSPFTFPSSPTCRNEGEFVVLSDNNLPKIIFSSFQEGISEKKCNDFLLDEHLILGGFCVDKNLKVYPAEVIKGRGEYLFYCGEETDLTTLLDFQLFCKGEEWQKKEGLEKCNELFDQILSTFKFIEKDETANWQTYRNEESGFEFKYPEGWEIKGLPQKNNQTIYFDPPYPGDHAGEPIAFSVVLNINNVSLQEYIKEHVEHASSEDVTSNIQIAGIQGTQRVFYHENLPSAGPSAVVLFANDNKVFIFNATRKKPIFDQILSTFKFIEKDETVDENKPGIYSSKGGGSMLLLNGEKTEFPVHEFKEQEFILFTNRKFGDYGAKDRSLKTISTKYPFEEKNLSNEIGYLIFGDFDLFEEADLYFGGKFADGPGSHISVFMFKPESKDFIYFVREAMLDVDIKIASSKSSTIFNAEKKARRLLGENEDSLSDNDIEIIINNERLSKEDVDNGHLIKDQEAIFNCRPPGFIVSNDYYNHPDRYFDSYGDMVDRGKINIRRYVEYFPDKFPCFVNEESDEITGYFDLVENKFVSVSSL